MVLLSDPPNEARRAYLRGVAEGIRPDSAEGVEPTVLTVSGGPDEYYRRVKQVLREESTDAKELPMIVAPCDELASACVRALASLGQSGVPVVGMGGAPGSMAYLLRGGPGTASLACFPETYGERAVGLAVRMLNGEEVPANYYAEHALLTPSNLTQYYPDLRCRN
jgi:ABC-type sugar transport system substrate-binding protein